MDQKINILEICNGLWIGWTEKTMQIFCKYLDKNKYNVFACWLFKWGERKEIIQKYVSDILVAYWEVQQIKDFVIKNHIHIVHWHSITQNAWEEYEKSLELLEFFKSRNIRIIETSPFSLYNERIDDLLDYRFFVSKNTLLKFIEDNSIDNIWKYDYLYNPLDIELLKNNLLNLEEKNSLKKSFWFKNTDILVWMIWRDDLWRWDDSFIYLIWKYKKNSTIKFIFKKIPDYYKNILIQKQITQNCVFLDLSSDEKDISDFHQIIDINLHDTRLWETFWLSIAESIFFNKIVLTPYIDYKNKYIYDRNSWQFEFLEFYDKLFFYDWKKDLVSKFTQLLDKNNFTLKNKTYNDFEIYNPNVIINKFIYIINNNFNNLKKEKEIFDYNVYYNQKFVKRENIFIYLFKNIKGLYYYLIIQITRFLW